MTDWSFQLYSARNFLPWDGILKSIAEAGYTQVEGYGGVYEDPNALRAQLDAAGLTMPSGHFSVDILENRFDEAVDIASTLGVRLMVCPYLNPADRPTDAEGYSAFGRRLEAIGEKARAAGFDFAWHNHDFEFVALPDGSIPQKLIFDAAPQLGWEMDVAWVIRGGADPVAWIADYADRVVAVHVKDIAPAGENTDEDGWSDVGHGTVDWRGLVSTLKAKTPAKLFIMEHDNPSDYRRFAQRSIETVKAF
ncbi:sugar phosphate isomerase/epimerase family protein [Oryzicola mucosus]|uniref:Sugar phosphate isomerase/epimerase n=1 Tax=Oryzicola mucosus TaxID=2767425 RepID=A0A8J6Q0V2_9HYPH|nr:sugar phosphate isomerase/epimerase [Oryzicola mucosus]MBD0414200.1 sugar phosphate isomerase/epimerase [Oryzicola mucosus]